MCSLNHCWRKKVLPILKERQRERACVCVALLMQHAKRIRHIKLSFVVCLVLPYFFTLSHKNYNFRKRLIEYKICCYFLCKFLSETFLILRRIQQDVFSKM
jgi:hypothetical protein